MARNRKRRSDRRPSRPAGAGQARPGVATASVGREESPSSLEHAAPDVELAEAQLARGRADADRASEEPVAEEPAPVGSAELSGAPDGDVGFEEDEAFDEDELDSEGSGGGRDGSRSRSRNGGGGDGAGESLTPAPAVRRHPGSRLVQFAQGSWRELQRVQWPDRRQVVQATGVVIGFVIVAGAFLGGADWVAQKIVHFILQ